MLEFHCKNCEIFFSENARRKEYNSPIYGPCSKNVADCPKCGMECSERIKPKPGKAKMEPSCGTPGACNSCSFQH